MTAKYIGGALAAFALLLTGTAHADSLRWTGQVDDTAIIRVDGRDVRTQSNAHGARDVRFNVSGRLPNRATRVRLVRESGRGDIDIIEQPSERNHYVATIRIKDGYNGSDRYGFRLEWSNSQNNERGNGRRDNDGWGNGRRDDNGRGNGRRPF